ncbi:MAG TPA: hypothetical protein VKZ18_17880 [Polyangia bacterium]|nr:hypothetical protein [Polyangia bacterium]
MGIISRFWRAWAVEALFGRTTARQRTLFTALIALAIAWPVLLFGIVRPKLAVQVLALVPLPDVVPDWTVRVLWVALTFLLPLGMGTAVVLKAPRAPRGGPLVRRVLRGFPITVGLTVSFGIIFLSVPVMRLAAFVRRQRALDVPLVMDAAAYGQVAGEVCRVLNRQGFAFCPAEPGWWVSVPIRLLMRLGGPALRSHVPAHLEHFETAGLAMTLYPSGLLLRGDPERLAWAHALIAESVVHTEGLQTIEPKAQALERRLRPLWRRHDADPAAARHDPTLLRELDRATRDLKALQVRWDDWQVLYRQLLQLERAMHGEPPLLEGEPPAWEPRRQSIRRREPRAPS